MAVSYCGHQLARRLWGAPPAYHYSEVAAPYLGACKDRLHYDERSDWRFEVRVGMWIVGSLSGKGGEVCEVLRKRMTAGLFA